MDIPLFPPRQQIEFRDDEATELTEAVIQTYEQRVRDRSSRARSHEKYDQMYRGKVKEFNPRKGPWENSANTHVQMPYWLVDALNARATHMIWSQNPLVVGKWEDPSDQPKMQRSSRLVEWNLQPRRMNARAMWDRGSKIRFIHGHSVTWMYYANVLHQYRIIEPPRPEDAYKFNGAVPQVDQQGNPEQRRAGPRYRWVRKTKYQGPVMYPMEWDDVLAPEGCMNYQPNSPENPGGADSVILRYSELLSTMLKKYDGGNGDYAAMMDNRRTRLWWEQQIPKRSAGTSGELNDQRRAQQNRMDGITPNHTPKRDNRTQNPTAEILVYFGPWRHPELNEDVEMMLFFCRNPRIYLGGYALTDVLYTGVRPLLEMHYKTVSNTIYSMGVCELVEYLSNELDTIHNLRIDVGFATNMPWYFVRRSSGMKGSQIQIKPLALVPVDSPNDVVNGHNGQNVTAFYHEEETLLLSIVERVMGVADLFLGVNVRGGASARHATGFQGQREESEARLADVIAQDAESFSFMCRTINDMEFMYGPKERRFRLTGELGEGTTFKINREDLFYQGEYDFTLGANVGMYSQQFRTQRAMEEYQMLLQNPLVGQDLGRIWEITAEVLRASGHSEAEIEMRIGPKSALPTGDQKTPSQAVNEIIGGKYGPDGFPHPHPNDDNAKFIEEIMAFVQSDAFRGLGQTNIRGLMNYLRAHQEAFAMKQQQMMMMQQQGPPQQPTPLPQGPAPNNGSGQMGGMTMQDTYASQTGQGPPNA